MNIHDERLPRQFWDRVEVGEGGCWLWIGRLNNSGYSMFKPPRGKLGTAHRYAYKILVGPIDGGLVCDHVCNTTRCVNPEHIRITTNRENVLRSDKAPTAINARKTHCIHGHALVEGNLSKSSTGYRLCLQCHRRSEAHRRSSWSPDLRATKLKAKREAQWRKRHPSG